jgi:hypothetical protein
VAGSGTAAAMAVPKADRPRIVSVGSERRMIVVGIRFFDTEKQCSFDLSASIEQRGTGQYIPFRTSIDNSMQASILQEVVDPQKLYPWSIYYTSLRLSKVFE